MTAILYVNQLPVGTSVTSADLLATVQSGIMVQSTVAKLATAVLGGTPFSATFVGSGLPANMQVNSNYTLTAGSPPFVGSQWSVTSNFGSSNVGLNFTVGQSVSALGGPNSGNIYALNPIVQGYAGSYQVTGIEVNLNNIGADALNLAASTSAFGYTATAAGSFKSTSGFRAYGLASPAGYNYGFAAHGNIIGAAFYDASSPGASSSFVGQSGIMAGSITQSRQAMLHGYSGTGNAFQIVQWLEQDNGGTGTAALGLSVSSSGTETRSAKAGFGLTRSLINGRGALTAYNRQTNDAASFTAADAMMSWGLNANFSGQTVFHNVYQQSTASLAGQAETVAHFGIVSSVGGTNPSINYKMGLSFDATANPGSGYIWGQNGVANLPASLARATTALSGTGTVATVTFAGGTTIPVGQLVQIYGVTPTAYNGTFTVTASSAGSASYASAATGVQTIAGIIAEQIGAIGSEIDLNVSNAPYSSNGGPYAANMFLTGTTASAATYGTAGMVIAYGGGVNPLWNYGILGADYVTARAFRTAFISDQSRSPIVLHSNTAHTNGIDFSGATFSGGSALVSANNTNISFLDSGAVARVAIAIDGANTLQLGAAALANMNINAPKTVFATLPGNYANDAAAAAGGIVIGGIYRTASALMVRVS